ncbi:MAG: hypothetical protein IH623_20220 [Verrucomicrobia bacterium]|nr:hypothetical protein [Verrucomicrobiota bacterium]
MKCTTDYLRDKLSGTAETASSPIPAKLVAASPDSVKAEKMSPREPVNLSPADRSHAPPPAGWRTFSTEMIAEWQQED